MGTKEDSWYFPWFFLCSAGEILEGVDGDSEFNNHRLHQNLGRIFSKSSYFLYQTTQNHCFVQVKRMRGWNCLRPVMWTCPLELRMSYARTPSNYSSDAGHKRGLVMNCTQDSSSSGRLRSILNHLIGRLTHTLMWIYQQMTNTWGCGIIKYLCRINNMPRSAGGSLILSTLGSAFKLEVIE